MSASMAGKYLGQFEADLKVQLMQRCTRNLSLTDAGGRVLPALQTHSGRVRRRQPQGERQAARGRAGQLRRNAYAGCCDALRSASVCRSISAFPLDEHYVDLRSEWIDVAIRLDRPSDSQLIARQLTGGTGFKRSSNYS
ncbi:hypothetical protein [Paraburkholderia sp. GAS333]|uniref:hypothetical protein n=1 Tax=Paraburkholderia sp. GAS333 TaxID=3156279 RepID=UPI003D1DFF96